MFADLFFWVFIIISLIYTVHFALYIAGANIYDIWQYRRLKKSERVQSSYLPLVSVLIPAHNESLGIRYTLDSVCKSSYQNIQIIVIDDASTDDTTEVVNAYIDENPLAGIRLIRIKKNVGKGGALNRAIKKHVQGELMMTLDGDSLLHEDAIKNAVTYFENKDVVGVAANVRISHMESVLGVLQRFEHMIGYRSKKFYTLTNSEFIIGGVASTYRTKIVKALKGYDTDTQTEDIGLSMKIIAHHGNKKYRIVYAADVLAATEGVLTFRALLKQRYRWKMGMLQNLIKYRSVFAGSKEKYSRMLALYRIPMAFLSEMILLIEPILILYLIYFSLVNETPALFIGAYLINVAYVLWTIWPDEHFSNRAKLTHSTFAPLMYFIFYVMNLVQVIALVRCIWNAKKVVTRKGSGGTWSSPARPVGYANIFKS